MPGLDVPRTVDLGALTNQLREARKLRDRIQTEIDVQVPRDEDHQRRIDLARAENLVRSLEDAVWDARSFAINGDIVATSAEIGRARSVVGEG